VKPDGLITVKFKNQDKRTFLFNTFRFWRRDPAGLVVSKEDGYTIFPWHDILSIDVIRNSDRYIEWLRDQSGEGVQGPIIGGERKADARYHSR